MVAPRVIKIETERLVLRNLKPSDVSQDYLDRLNTPEVNKYLSCANTLQTMETYLAYVRSYQSRNDAALIGIFLKEKELHIGNLTLSAIDLYNKSAGIGICLARKEYMRQGLAKEALSAMIGYCFEELELHRLAAGMNVHNTLCFKLFKKCGFKIEGLLRDSSNINGQLQDSYLVSVLKTDL